MTDKKQKNNNLTPCKRYLKEEIQKIESTLINLCDVLQKIDSYLNNNNENVVILLGTIDSMSDHFKEILNSERKYLNKLKKAENINEHRKDLS